MSLATRALRAGLRRPDIATVDPLRFPDPPPPASLAQRRAAGKWLWSRRRDAAAVACGLVDAKSRRVYAEVLAARVAGHQRIRLGPGPPRFAELQRFAEQRLMSVPKTRDLGFMGWHANRYDLSAVGLEATVEVAPINVVYTFLLEEYRHPDHPQSGVRAGDVVIDGGACYGDTALYLAAHAGANGRVLAFEVLPEHLVLLRDNLAANPVIGGRVGVHEEALWSSMGTTLELHANGPGTTVTPGTGAATAPSRSIDSLVDTGVVDRIDFIKLDVEGAERQALRGAEQVLRQFRPRLAVSIYHGMDDVLDIPLNLMRTLAGYRFAVSHLTSHTEETKLFAWPR
jgi:FkbM family methyltransferase